MRPVSSKLVRISNVLWEILISNIYIIFWPIFCLMMVPNLQTSYVSCNFKLKILKNVQKFLDARLWSGFIWPQRTLPFEFGAFCTGSGSSSCYTEGKTMHYDVKHYTRWEMWFESSITECTLKCCYTATHQINNCMEIKYWLSLNYKKKNYL